MGKKIVLTYYWTGEYDIWHKDIGVYKPNPSEFHTLYDSVAGRGYDFVTIANELVPDKPNWTVYMDDELKKPDGMTLYVHKFIACYKYLLKHPEYDEIWIVDSSDTEMLKAPEPKDNMVYSGYDMYSPIFRKFVPVKYLVGGNAEGVWVPGIFELGHKYDYVVDKYLRDEFGEEIAWNCGIFGGKRAPAMEFLSKLCELLEKTDSDTEMTIFNYVIFLYFKDRCKCIATRMTLGEKDYSKWWRHK